MNRNLFGPLECTATLKFYWLILWGSKQVGNLFLFTKTNKWLIYKHKVIDHQVLSLSCWWLVAPAVYTSLFIRTWIVSFFINCFLIYRYFKIVSNRKTFNNYKIHWQRCPKKRRGTTWTGVSILVCGFLTLAGLLLLRLRKIPRPKYRLKTMKLKKYTMNWRIESRSSKIWLFPCGRELTSTLESKCSKIPTLQNIINLVVSTFNHQFPKLSPSSQFQNIIMWTSRVGTRDSMLCIYNLQDKLTRQVLETRVF